MTNASRATGRLLQVNVSSGGLPKLPVESAQVGRIGLSGDRQNRQSVHGGPHRAVCLFGIEAIRRIQGEGHPVGPGSVGENFTTEGIEWSLLPVGTRVHVGGSVLLELASPAMPCETQAPNFEGGRIGRISVRLYPSDSRMYARVLAEGEVRSGDPIVLYPPAPGSDALIHLLLDRLDDCEGEANLRLWRAAEAAGRTVLIVDDFDLVMAASSDLPGPTFNTCSGLRTVPHLLPVVLDRYRSAGTSGWLPMESKPWPGAEPEHMLATLSGDPSVVASASESATVTVRRLEPGAWRSWAQLIATSLTKEEQPQGLADCAPQLLATRNVLLLLAEDRGAPIGSAILNVHRRVGMVRDVIVAPGADRDLVQRAASARAAVTLNCDVMAAYAPLESSTEKIAREVALQRIWVRPVYRFDPSAATLDVTAMASISSSSSGSA